MILNLMGRNEFRDNFYEKKPCLIRSALMPGAVSWDDVNEALYIGEQGPNGIMLHKGGALVPESEYTELCIDIERRRRFVRKDVFHQLLAAGASIIFNRMESFSYPIRALSQELARYVGHDTAANGYISIGGDQAFGNHWDTHDVFAVQLIGQKHWKIYNPTFELPLPGQRSGSFKDHAPAQPVMEVTLEAGDILYVPRGWWHNAEALPCTPTFHVAVGVHPVIALDYIKWLMEEIFPSNLAFRGTIGKAEGERQLGPLASSMMAEVADPAHLRRFLTERSEGARWFSRYDIPFNLLASEEEFDMRMWVTTHWHRENTTIDTRLGQIDEAYRDVARVILKFVSESPRAVQAAELPSRLPSLSATTIARTIKRLVTIDLLSIAYGASV
jgi:ribosomal protein L16 Arg81 hydroxylase